MNLTLALAALVLFQQQPQPQVALGRIEGTVLRAGSTEPVSGARVTVVRVNAATGATVPLAGTITSSSFGGTTAALPVVPGTGTGPFAQALPAPGPFPPPPIPAVTTERDGKFVVPNLEEGAYRVTISLNGYVRQDYGQRVFPGQGIPLTLSRGEVLKDLVVNLTQTGAVNGRIIDNNGQPAANVPVQLLRASYNSSAQRTFTTAGRATTNDRGEYRIFWIAPGRYYVAAGTSPGDGSASTQLDNYVFTFYPGTQDVSRASMLDVKSGSESVLDLVVPKQQHYRIRGRIIDALSQAPNLLGLSLAVSTQGGSSAAFTYSQAYNPATGLFEIRDLMPATYVLQVNTGTATARVPVTVTNADIENLSIVVSTGTPVAGQARIENAATAAIPPETRVALRPVVPEIANFVGFAPNATPNAVDGTFRLERVLRGEYRVVVQPPNDHYVKAVLLDRSDVLNRTIEIGAADNTARLLDVVLSPNVAQIDGVVSDDRLQPMSGVQVVLVPDRNRERSELFKAVTSDQSGKFILRGIAPGDYRLFAWEGLENFAYFDPDFLKRSEPLGKALHLDESAKLNVELKAIR
jgi:hypothetical protein